MLEIMDDQNVCQSIEGDKIYGKGGADLLRSERRQSRTLCQEFPEPVCSLDSGGEDSAI